MPFKSEKQRRYLFANEPELAKKWSNMYGKKIIGLGGVSKKSPKGYYVLYAKEELATKFKPVTVWYQNKKDATKFAKSLEKSGYVVMTIKEK